MIGLIAAVSENGIIGVNNVLPWNDEEDMKFFRKTTVNSTVIMGRNTMNSIISFSGKLLPKRRNIVISSTKQCAETFKSLSEAFQHVAPEENVWVIGGAQLYREALSMSMVERAIINKIHVMVETKQSDIITFLPWIDPTKYMVASVVPSDTFTTFTYLRSV